MIKKLQLIMMAIVSVFVVGTIATAPAYASKCGETDTQLIACNASGKGATTIGDLIKIVVSVMTVIIGIVATGGLAYAALLYASAQDNQNKVSESITIIRNIVIGILLYGFMVAIVNWLIPGGVIG